MTLSSCLLLATFGSTRAAAQDTDAPDTDLPPSRRPNIVLIIVDDAGYSDFGAYGGDASTPVIDGLAKRGTKFACFYASPQCGPSRAMLLTGSDNHEVGIGTINETMTDELASLPGYTMKLDSGSLTLAERLGDAGYYTVATGKWGIGKPGSSLPGLHGFDRSHVLDASGADNWEQKPYIPLYDTAPWYADGQPITLPDDFYSSEYIVDRTIELIDAGNPDTPFFAHVGFQALHVPVQVSREYRDRYDGRFDEGWDVARANRSARARQLGLIPEGVPAAALPDDARSWGSLSAAEQERSATMMQVNAGMLEAMDHQIGRLLDHLESKGVADHTLVIVVSDNGPDNNTLPAEHAPWAAEGPLIERLGEKGTTASIGTEWATVSAAPLSLFKFNTSEGGVRVPMVIAGPGVPATDVVHARAHIMDVVPTVLDLAGVPLVPSPAGAPPVRGRSLVPILRGTAAEVYGSDDAVAVEVAGNAALYRGSYKLVKLTPPYGDGGWRLYDVQRDPGETRDLSEENEGLKLEMIAEYEALATELGVAALPASYSPVTQIWLNSLYKHPVGFVKMTAGMAFDASPAITVAALVGVLLAPFIGIGLVVRRRWRSGSAA